MGESHPLVPKFVHTCSDPWFGSEVVDRKECELMSKSHKLIREMSAVVRRCFFGQLLLALNKLDIEKWRVVSYVSHLLCARAA